MQSQGAGEHSKDVDPEDVNA
jgi:R3H domain